MVLINKAINEVTVKLVYYGPGLCGKTTNLEKIYENPKMGNKGKMISMSTETDRTLFFDFMPMELGTISGQKVRVQIYTVPGQVFYDATRKLVLRGADGVVFVADSQSSMRESNIESLDNLKANLRANRLDPDKIAIVFQYNKRDLPNVSSIEDMNAYLHPGTAPVVEAAALEGTGVGQTLRLAVAKILDNLRKNVDITMYDQPPLRRPDMTATAGISPSSSSRIGVTHGGETPLPRAASRPLVDAPRFSPAPPTPPPSAQPPEAFPFAAPDAEVAFADVAGPEDDLEPQAAEEQAFEPSSASTVEVPHQLEVNEPFADEPLTIQETAAEPEDSPFATPDPPARSIDEELVAMMLQSAREVIASLEQALEAARAHERALIEKLRG
jgi:signal recognition particle receptor subunit beta